MYFILLRWQMHDENAAAKQQTNAFQKGTTKRKKQNLFSSFDFCFMLRRRRTHVWNTRTVMPVFNLHVTKYTRAKSHLFWHWPQRNVLIDLVDLRTTIISLFVISSIDYCFPFSMNFVTCFCHSISFVRTISVQNGQSNISRLRFHCNREFFDFEYFWIVSIFLNILLRFQRQKANRLTFLNSWESIIKTLELVRKDSFLFSIFNDILFNRKMRHSTRSTNRIPKKLLKMSHRSSVDRLDFLPIHTILWATSIASFHCK